MPKLPWIGCDLLRLEYDFRRQAAVLYLRPGECTDMDRAIELVARIDGGVREIRTIAGDVEDTKYTRSGGGWSAEATDE